MRWRISTCQVSMFALWNESFTFILLSVYTMLSHLLVCCVLAVTVSSRQLIKKLQRTDEPVADGNPDFIYINDKTKAAADTIKQFNINAQEDLNKYTLELKTSNDILTSLKAYETAVSSVAGTSCEIPKENVNKFTGTQENIEVVLELCAASVPADDFDSLNKSVTEDLAKIQAIDNTIRLNSQICFSLRMPPSKPCQRALQSALDRLKIPMSQEELAKLDALSHQASEGAKKNLEQCFNDKTKCLLKNINESLQAINDCKANEY